MSTPVMRTVPEAAKALKMLDPCTAVTPHAIRQMVIRGEIPHMRIGCKRLINMEILQNYLASPHESQHPDKRDHLEIIEATKIIKEEE